ncbi:MAG: endolytic transglycosylase MltG [Bacteroidota bacterium]|nr:endolytic transglycosylase MltG [Bacteroidota bacterium]
MSRVVSALLLVLVIAGAVTAWLVLGSGTGFSEKSRYFIVPEGKTDPTAVLEAMEQEQILSHPAVFKLLASRTDVWNKLKPGKYEVKKGTSSWKIARMLRNGRLAELKLVINKIRTKEDLAHLISKNFAPDSVSVMRYLNSNDSLKKFGVDTSKLFTLIIPDTYSFYWNTSITRILRRLADEQKGFWAKNDRLAKAGKMNFTPEQVYILASIVEEETNYESDKYKIASVYINRLKKQMPLQACPTIKYAMKDFTLTRIYEKYLFNPSPYNTYRVKGLPPGPICTPSPKTIDIVLNAPNSDYLYFVAKSDFSGYHHFSSNYAEHDRYAKEYQKALDAYMARKQEKEAKKP